MKRLFSYRLKIIAILIVLVSIFSCQTEEETDFSERAKIVLRDVGNKLLLSNNDSTSLIFPIKELGQNNYQLTFSRPFSFEPSTLTSIVEKSLKSINLSENYRVEVLLCTDNEVAYSYQMSAEVERTIIPCSGRYLPEACYIIKVNFLNKEDGYKKENSIPYIIIFLVLITVASFFYYKKTKSEISNENRETTSKIGSFYFYPDQNKLVKETIEIALSKKECELLEVFVAHPNQIIKRDELTKRVWEDNGVFVGRSLDTYISKLRKKLKSDTSIKLTNVHGIGYKLEID